MIFGQIMHLPHLSTIIFWFLCLGFLVWAYRSFRLILTLYKIPKMKGAGAPRGELVSVIIPAKNEETHIAACWHSLKNQTYPQLEVLVINDNSTDKTEAILKELGAFFINCPPAPEGWTGKNHALDHGSRHAKGSWLLFTDADTRHQPESVATAVAYAQSHGLEFLSLLPHCLTGSFVEAMIQPLAMGFLGLWFPLDQGFANGQYLLIRRSLYDRLGGHKAVAGAFLEDFALMHLAKQNRAPAACGFGMEIYGTRMYDSWQGIWKGWRRIYLHAFRQKTAPLLMNALSVFCFSVIPYGLALFLLAAQEKSLFILSAVLIALITLVGSQVHRTVRAHPWFAVFHPAAALIIFLIVLDAAGMALTNKKTIWR